MKQKLIFVYNADSSLFNQVGDLIHKTISPRTYKCNLCGLTYSGVNMKDEWKNFIKSLPVEVELLHKDEFLREFPKAQDTNFPIAFIKQNGNLIKLISTEEINRANNLEMLKNLVQGKVSTITT